MPKESKEKIITVTHTRRQKIIGCVALAGLFVCGLMVGFTINSHHARRAPINAELCENLSDMIKGQMLNPAMQIEKLKQLGDMYATNCRGYVPMHKDASPSPAQSSDSDKETCAVVEDLLKARLNPEYSQDYKEHAYNIGVYEKLVARGCAENRDEYYARIARENEIMSALADGYMNDEVSTCEQIESLLMEQIQNPGNNPQGHIENAKLYANMSERGCTENTAKYVALAKQELEIARALSDDKLGENATLDTVETYKRLHMQAAAEEVLDKVKKLTNPAIDFIIQIEKIINE